MNIDNSLGPKCINSEDMEQQDPKSENQSEEKEMKGGNDAEKKEYLYSSTDNPKYERVDCDELSEIKDDRGHHNISEGSKTDETCNNIDYLSNMQIKNSVVETNNPMIVSNNRLLELTSCTRDTNIDPVHLESNVDNSVITLDSGEPEPRRNISTITLNKFNEDPHELQNAHEKYPNTMVSILEKTEHNKPTYLQNKYNLNTDYLKKNSEQRNDKSSTSILVPESIDNLKEIYANDKNRIIPGEKKIKVIERRDQIIEILDHINQLKNKFTQSNTSAVTELLSSKGVYLGMLTELSLYEELLKYLLERRNLYEETFECNDFEDNQQSLNQTDNYIGPFTNLQRENTETYYKRTVLEGIVDFAGEKFSLESAFAIQSENPETKSTNRIIKHLNAYYELFSRDCVVFFDNALTYDQDFKNLMVPIQAYNAATNLSNMNLNFRINKIKKEIDIISKYSTHDKFRVLDKMTSWLEFIAKNSEKNDFKIFDNCILSHFLSGNNDEAPNRNQLNSNLQALTSNYVSTIRVNFGNNARFSKENLLCNLFKNKLQDIQNRLNNLDKYILINENNKNEESKNKSIVSQLLSIENMLQTIIPESFATKSTPQERVNMEEILLYGFTIGETRKSDLKKISNLVKSKVSSCTGRRGPKHENEGRETQVSEVETHRAAELEKIKSLLEDFVEIENKELTIRFNDFSTILGKLMEKDTAVKYFLSMLESIDLCEKMHIEIRNNIDKIQGITNILLDIIKKNIIKVGEPSINT